MTYKIGFRYQIIHVENGFMIEYFIPSQSGPKTWVAKDIKEVGKVLEELEQKLKKGEL